MSEYDVVPYNMYLSTCTLQLLKDIININIPNNEYKIKIIQFKKIFKICSHKKIIIMSQETNDDITQRIIPTVLEKIQNNQFGAFEFPENPEILNILHNYGLFQVN